MSQVSKIVFSIVQKLKAIVLVVEIVRNCPQLSKFQLLKTKTIPTMIIDTRSKPV